MPRPLGSQLFFAMWGLALALIASAVVGNLWLIDAFVHQDIKLTLAASRIGVSRYLEMQRALLARSAEAAAAVPMLKATLEIEQVDRATASVAAEMVREFADIGFCVLLSPGGAVLASTLRATGPDPPIDTAAWLMVVDDHPYIIATADVNSGAIMVGRLVLGHALDGTVAADLRALTGSEAFVLLAGRLVAGSHLDAFDPNTTELAAFGAVAPEASTLVEFGGVSHVVTTVQLPAGASVVLARSVDGLTGLHRRLIGVVAVSGLIGGLAALLIAQLVARRIAQPLRALTAAVADFAHGDQEAKVIPVGSLETVRLGAAFNDMVRHLDQAQRSLVRAERFAAIGQLTVTMNHEMNNPLQGLLTAVDLALVTHSHDPESPELKESLEAIRESGHRLRDAVRQITSLTNADATPYVGDTSMIDITPPKS